MKYKDYKITKKQESYQVTKGYQLYYDKDDLYQVTEYRDIYLVNGPGFRNRKFYKLDEAKRAINVRQRKIDTSFSDLKRDIREAKKKIKSLELQIKRKERWMAGY